MASGGVATTGVESADQVNFQSNYPNWVYAVLQALGATPTPVNTKAVYLWGTSELGSIPATNNWFAITAPAGNYNEWGTIGSAKAISNYGQYHNAVQPGLWNELTLASGGGYSVLTYPTFSAGVNAFVKFLNAGHTGIIDALRDPNASLTSIGKAINKDGGWSHDGDRLIKADGRAITVDAYGAPQGPGSTPDAGANGSSTFTQCSSKDVIIGTPGIIGSFGSISILNACQAKALVGGLLVASGAIIMFAGVALTVGGITLRGLNSDTVKEFKKAGDVFKFPRRRRDVEDKETAAERDERERNEAKKAWEAKYGMPWEQSSAGRARRIEDIERPR